ncbi:MAG TPA: energy transducer TonB [Chthoniobacterales bacterium]|nr:energy transducer TonB [Chthoniobacterales bacterium]
MARMPYYCRAITCAIGALILALPASAADPASVQRERKSPAAKARYITASGVILLRTDPKSGKVLQATMFKSTGNKTLDAAAVKAFRNQSVPADGASQRKIPISFRVRVD